MMNIPFLELIILERAPDNGRTKHTERLIL